MSFEGMPEFSCRGRPLCLPGQMVGCHRIVGAKHWLSSSYLSIHSSSAMLRKVSWFARSGKARGPAPTGMGGDVLRVRWEVLSNEARIQL